MGDVFRGLGEDGGCTSKPDNIDVCSSVNSHARAPIHGQAQGRIHQQNTVSNILVRVENEVFSEDPDALIHVQWEVLKALMILVLSVYDMEDFIRIAYEEELNADRNKFMFDLFRLHKTTNEAILAIARWEMKLDDFIRLLEYDVNSILEDVRVFELLIQCTMIVMKQLRPLKRNYAMHLMMELTQEKCRGITDVLLLEPWGCFDFLELRRLEPPVKFVGLDVLACQIFEAMDQLIEWKGLELHKSMKSATFPLRSGVFGNCTEEVIEVVGHADCERRSEGHRFIGSHHLLLGLVRTRIGGSVLKFVQLRQALEEPVRNPRYYIYGTVQCLATIMFLELGRKKISLGDEIIEIIEQEDLSMDECVLKLGNLWLLEGLKCDLQKEDLSINEPILKLGKLCMLEELEIDLGKDFLRNSMFSSLKDRGGEDRVFTAAKGAAFLAHNSFSRISWTRVEDEVFSEDPDALTHVQWEVLKALMILVLSVYDMEDFIRIAYEEELNAERNKFMFDLFRLHKTTNEAILAIARWEMKLDDFILLHENDRNYAMHLMMELTQEKCRGITDVLLLEPWGCFDFLELHRLEPPVKFVGFDVLACQIFEAMDQLIEWKGLELHKSMKSATFPLRSGVFGNCTEEVIEVVGHADCARRSEGHRFISSHHLLLGLLRTRIRGSVLKFVQLRQALEEPEDLSINEPILKLGKLCMLEELEIDLGKDFQSNSLDNNKNAWNAGLSSKRFSVFLEGLLKLIRRQAGKTSEGSVWGFISSVSKSWGPQAPKLRV
ncbi:hypothetical protein HYC85_019005 [Camellia sinensis]|uniref:Clp R domain-containing protein n=1 Tax=Camellia sinensis TaxID=4442 RepID=A0A7J7GZS3_CAMSI|nr:hypothetical protein HYC85_019005 [Camellia sinensis]